MQNPGSLLKNNHHERWNIPVWLRFAVPAGALMLAMFSLLLDLSVARYFQESPPQGFLEELVLNTEPFGHGVGIIVILVCIGVCHLRQARAYAHAGLLILCASAVTNAVKLNVNRIRPRNLDWAADLTVWDTFQGLFPYLEGIKSGASFPSGHTTAAFALAVCLSVLHPRARYIFFLLAGSVGVGRIMVGAHFPSDVLIGLAIGWSVPLLLIFAVGHNDLAKLYRREGAVPAPPVSEPAVDSLLCLSAADETKMEMTECTVPDFQTKAAV